MAVSFCSSSTGPDAASRPLTHRGGAFTIAGVAEVSPFWGALHVRRTAEAFGMSSMQTFCSVLV